MAFGRATEQHAVRHHHCHAARLGLHDLDHVQDEGVVALGARRQAATEAVVRVDFGGIVPPFFQRKRRVGHYDVEVLEGLRLC